MKLSEIWITCPSPDVAERIAEELVSAKLAACGNILGNVRSVYRWQGNVEKAAEVALVLKTRDRDFDAISEKVRSLHPYDTPAIVAVPILHVSRDYGDWVIDSTERHTR